MSGIVILSGPGRDILYQAHANIVQKMSIKVGISRNWGFVVAMDKDNVAKAISGWSLNFWDGLASVWLQVVTIKVSDSPFSDFQIINDNDILRT